MRVFVTGATGFLGHHVTAQLVERGHHVTALVRSAAKAERFLPSAVGRVIGDMSDVAAFSRELAGHDAVVHTAAYFREYDGSPDHVAALRRINVDGTLALARAAAAAHVARFVDISSAGIIGRKPDGSPGDESTPPDAITNTNHYFNSKREAEELLRAEAAALHLEVVWILPGLMFGPGDDGPTAAGRIIRNYLRGLAFVFPEGAIAIVDARDVASAVCEALVRGRPGERYIVSGSCTSLREIGESLARVSGRLSPVMLGESLSKVVAWSAEQWARVTGTEPLLTRMVVDAVRAELAVDATKAEHELGFTARPIDDTMRASIDWFRDDMARRRARN